MTTVAPAQMLPYLSGGERTVAVCPGPHASLSFDEPKSAAAVLDYTVDWSPWLEPIGDELVNVVFTVAPAGPAQAGDCTVQPTSPEFQDGLASCWISGGVSGHSYFVTSTIITAGGRSDSRRITLQVIS